MEARNSSVQQETVSKSDRSEVKMLRGGAQR